MCTYVCIHVIHTYLKEEKHLLYKCPNCSLAWDQSPTLCFQHTEGFGIFFSILVLSRGSWKMCSRKFTCLWKAGGAVSGVSVVPCPRHCSGSCSLPILPSEAASANHRPNLGEVKYKSQTTVESRVRVWTQTRDLSRCFSISLLAATNV